MTDACENYVHANSTGAQPNRRTVLRTAAAAGAVGAVGVTAAACGSGASTGGSGASTGGSLTIATSKVPVGGGFIDTSTNVVVTQPTAGQYKAFTAVCTHKQCTVGSVRSNVIICPCHGSQFSASDGSVKQGPATSALAAKQVKVEGSNLIVS